MSTNRMLKEIPDPRDEVAVIHHDGAYALWSLTDQSPLTTGLPREKAQERLKQQGFKEADMLEVLENARQHGSSVPAGGYYPFKTASVVIEENRGGAFGEEVPNTQMFRHLLIQRAPLP